MFKGAVYAYRNDSTGERIGYKAIYSVQVPLTFSYTFVAQKQHQLKENMKKKEEKKKCKEKNLTPDLSLEYLSRKDLTK